MPETKYKSDFCVDVVKYGQEGLSKTQIASKLGISYTTLHSWEKDPNKLEFKNSMDLATTCAEAYWEVIGLQGTKGVLPKFNATSWIFTMKNRFRERWRDVDTQKIELSNSIKGMTDKEIDDTIKALIARKMCGKEDSKSGAPNQLEVQ